MQSSDCKTCSNGAVSNDRSNATPMVGRRFGRLTVEKLVCIAPRHWRCKCACGNAVVCEGSNLRRGHVKSCGHCNNVPRYADWKRAQMGAQNVAAN